MVGTKSVFGWLMVLASASVLSAEEGAPTTQPTPPVHPTVDATEPYTLAEGEVLKRVPPPFVEGRLGIYRATGAAQAEAIPDGANAMILRYDNGKLTFRGGIFGESYSLSILIDMILEVPEKDIDGDRLLLDRRIAGDFVVRKGATPDQLRDALAKIVSDDTNGKTLLTQRPMDHAVIILKGEWTGAVPNPAKTFLDVYGGLEVGDATTTVESEGSGTMEEFGVAVGKWIKKPVVVEASGGPLTVAWKIYNSRDPAAHKTARESALVLQHLEEQTGLKASEEVRKLPRLVVEAGP